MDAGKFKKIVSAIAKGEMQDHYKKIRKTWDINPVERKVKDKKQYDRNKVKRDDRNRDE